jgi:ABC-type lipoprotein export system ATPase subunit
VVRLLEARSLSRSFSTGGSLVPVLANLCLEVKAGDFLVITGPSGSGKSTLLNLLSGLDRPSSGEVEFRGQALTQLAAAAIARLRNLAFGHIFQTPHLLQDRTVAENVALPFQYGPSCPQEEIRDRVAELLRYVGVATLAERRVATLSGGEMQRVVFARALVRRPEVVFADEPTGSLDADNSGRILTMLREQAGQGCAVVLVTHDPVVAGYGTSRLHLAKLWRDGGGQ